MTETIRQDEVAASEPRCQKCGGVVQGWTCQGCGATFRENADGELVLEAPATGSLDREAVARLAWTYSCSSEPLNPADDNGWSVALDRYKNEPRFTESAKAFVDRTWAFADAVRALPSSGAEGEK